MLVMARELIALHAVVDGLMAALDSIADGLRVQGATAQRRNHAAAFEAQRLQQASRLNPRPSPLTPQPSSRLIQSDLPDSNLI